MIVSLCIIAKNEAHNIGNLIRSLVSQSIFMQAEDLEIVVIANGCSDDTTLVSHLWLEKLFSNTKVKFVVHDTPKSGKARAWNLAVHSVICPAADIIVFMDADIQILDENAICDLVSKLTANKDIVAVSGWPVKDIALKARKSIVDHFSLKVSSQTPALHSTNGQLYAAWAEELRKIWLPVPTPGEDGFLSAMIHTYGFSKPAQVERVQRADRPTHYYKSHTVSSYFQHERRIAIGTTINGWICEKLWADNHSTHVGSLIREWNDQDPSWVGRLVSGKVRGKRWALPPRLLTWRLYNLRGIGIARAVGRAPFSIMATVLNVWPCIQANRALKRQDAASIW